MRFNRIIQYKAAALIALGREAEALALWKDGMHLSYAISQTPTLSAFLAGAAIQRTMLHLARFGMERGIWSDGSLRTVSATLEQGSGIKTFHRALEGERAITNAIFDYMRISPEGMSEAVSISNSYGGSSSWLPAWLRIRRPSWVWENQVLTNQILDDILEIYNADRDELASDAALEAAWVARCKDPEINEVLAVCITTPLFTIRQKMFFQAAMSRMTLIGCALERFKFAKGTYPETFEELVPGYLERLPLDLRSGKGFIYRRVPEEGFLLYSVGLNGADDGGNAGTSKYDDLARMPDWRWFAPVKQ